MLCGSNPLPCKLSCSAKWHSISQEEYYQTQLKAGFDLAHCCLGHDTSWAALLHLSMTNFKRCLRSSESWTSSQECSCFWTLGDLCSVSKTCCLLGITFPSDEKKMGWILITGWVFVVVCPSGSSPWDLGSRKHRDLVLWQLLRGTLSWTLLLSLWNANCSFQEVCNSWGDASMINYLWSRAMLLKEVMMGRGVGKKLKGK